MDPSRDLGRVRLLCPGKACYGPPCIFSLVRHELEKAFRTLTFNVILTRSLTFYHSGMYSNLASPSRIYTHKGA